MVSALTQDMKTVYIDEKLLNKNYNENRFRYSLAHEIGHIYLHEDIYRDFPCKSVFDWKRFMDELDPKTHSRLEYQAYQFAGLTLVPLDLLKFHFTHIKDDLISNGQDPEDNYEMFEDYLVDQLTRKFRVSSRVIQKRIQYEGLTI